MIRPTIPEDTPSLVTLAEATTVFKPLEIQALREVLDDYHAHEKEFGHRCVTYEKDGSIDGCMYWRAVRIRSVPQCYFGTEAVRGFVRGREVELRGHQADHPGLALDVYELHLTGNDEAGVFAGRSRAYGDWSGRLEGRYLFQNRKN